MNPGIHASILDGRNEILLVTGHLRINGVKDQLISIIPITDVFGLSYTGLKWNLKNSNRRIGWFGIRNRMLGKTAEISLKSGKALVIKIRK